MVNILLIHSVDFNFLIEYSIEVHTYGSSNRPKSNVEDFLFVYIWNFYQKIWNNIVKSRYKIIKSHCPTSIVDKKMGFDLLASGKKNPTVVVLSQFFLNLFGFETSRTRSMEHLKLCIQCTNLHGLWHFPVLFKSRTKSK